MAKMENRQLYAEYLQQREDLKQIVLEHTQSNQFREHHKQLIKDYYATDEYRIQLFQRLDEYKSTRLGKFVKEISLSLFAIFFTAIITSAVTSFFMKSDITTATPLLEVIAQET